MRRRRMFLVFGLGLGILQGCVTPPVPERFERNG